MKYIISEQQYELLSRYQYLTEQPESVMDRRTGITDRNMVALGYDPKKLSDVKKYEDLINTIGRAEWDHTFATVASAIISFVPPPWGPVLSSIIQLADAGVYLYEGDQHSAGLAATFALMPYVGPIMKNFPIVAKLGPTKMAALVTKILSGATNFTRDERLFILTFEKNTGFFVREIRNIIKTYTPKFLRLFSKNPRLQQKVNEFANKGSYWIGELLDQIFTRKLYDLVFEQEIRIRVEEEGLNWQEVKKNFGSDGSRKDNELLVKAYNSHWNPKFKYVPEEFWTDTKRKEMQSLTPTIRNLKKILPADQAEKEIQKITKMYEKPGYEKKYPFESMGLGSPFDANSKSKQTTIKQDRINKS